MATADGPKLQLTKDFPLSSFGHCSCGWLDSSQWEWSYFFSQMKFFHFSPSYSSLFLIFFFYFFHKKIMFLIFFFLCFSPLLHFFSLENVCLHSLFLSSFMLYLPLWTKTLSSLCLFPIFFFSHAHTLPLLLSLISRYLCPQHNLKVKVQNREHLKT